MNDSFGVVDVEMSIFVMHHPEARESRRGESRREGYNMSVVFVKGLGLEKRKKKKKKEA